MSLFPAYAASEPSTSIEQNVPQTDDANSWLLNPSFNIPKESHQKYNESSSSATTENFKIKSNETEPTKKQKKSKKKHKRKKLKREIEWEKDKGNEKISEFTGKEDYYVDKKRNSGNLKKETLEKSDSPRYRTHVHRIGNLTSKELKIFYQNKHNKSKRYFSEKFMKQLFCENNENNEITLRKSFRLTEEEFAMQTKLFNQQLNENPKLIEIWLKYVNHQECFYAKLTKIQLAERKLEILNKAIRENPDADDLKQVYVGILEQTYPSFEVSKILETLLEKDSANYILWNAQIMATQGSMARCMVAEVLKLYKSCMKNMYKRNRIDEITLKLFGSCCSFLRQSGLSEQFFALIELALELNVNDIKFAALNRNDEIISNTLIEFEEIVLQSGLPMNEIWLRVEKLRQNFYFLPIKNEHGCNDPQRIVLNEDIYHYIYPLTNRENTFNLTLLILRLLKVPLPCNFWLRNNFMIPSTIKSIDNYSEFDAIEELLPLFFYRSIIKNPNDEIFNEIIWNMIFDLSNGPSYISKQIGFELYGKYISELLLLCAESFSESKRDTFILLWMKLERIQALIDIQLKNWTNEKANKLRSKIKTLLKRPENRNKLIYYIEFALIEYDLGHIDIMKNIFVAAISQSSDANNVTRAEFWFACISLIEILIRENECEKALNILTVVAIEGNLSQIDSIDNCFDAQKALACKKISDRLNELTFVERNVEIMEMEQGLLPDYYVSMIKAKIYLLLLWHKIDEDPIKCLETFLRTFIEKNPRHNFLREQIYEIYINALNFLNNENRKLLNGDEIFIVVCNALYEFPTNLTFLKEFSICEGQTWHKLRTTISKLSNPVSVIFLIALAQYRCKKYTLALQHSNRNMSEIDSHILDAISSGMNSIEQTYKIRVHNALRRLTHHDSLLRKNSILWRLYLRSTLDVAENFEKTKNILFLALNECPWNKALYMDGAVHLPQELSQIQDLIIEKQLRIYAMPEELEILRQDQ